MQLISDLKEVKTHNVLILHEISLKTANPNESFTKRPHLITDSNATVPSDADFNCCLY